MQQNTKNFLILSLVVLAASLTRLIPHPWNFAPLGAMALFGSVYMSKRGMGLLVTMIAWMFSDLILNNFVYTSGGGFVLFTEGAFFTYLSIALIYILGRGILSKLTAPRMIAGSMGAAVLFYVLSNFGVWMQGYYPMNASGLIACYVAALPFLKFTIAGNLFYGGVLFLLYERLLRSQLIPAKTKR